MKLILFYDLHLPLRRYKETNKKQECPKSRDLRKHYGNTSTSEVRIGRKNIHSLEKCDNLTIISTLDNLKLF